MEFGTNTGRQGTYDPRDPMQAAAAQRRLKQLEDEYGDRLQIGGTGSTGLDKNDAHGWARMQNAQTEAANIRNIAAGRGPMRIAYGGTMQSRSLPRSMGALDHYADEDRKALTSARAEESKGAWFQQPEELRTARMRQMQAGANIAQGMSTEQDLAHDPMTQKSRAGVADSIFAESAERRRPTILKDTRAMGELANDLSLEGKEGAMDLEMTHPLAAFGRAETSRLAQQRASMEALGRIFATRENFDAAGGLPGIMNMGGSMGGNAPAAGAAPGAGAVPADMAQEIAAEYLDRFGKAPTPEQIRTVYERYQASQSAPPQ